MKSFHYYFLSNNLGIIYDVLNDDFEKTLWAPFRSHPKKYDHSIYTGIEINGVGYKEGKFTVSGKIYDYLIIASDVKNTPKIIKKSKDLIKVNPKFARRIENVKSSQRYAVLRIWIDKMSRVSCLFLFLPTHLKS